MRKTRSESYRRCCTSISWVGSALSAHILTAEKLWNHDPYFDYVGRWMTEDDSYLLLETKKQTGSDLSSQPQRVTWDKFVDDMWAKYRDQYSAENEKRSAMSRVPVFN